MKNNIKILLVSMKYHNPPFNGTSLRDYNIFKNLSQEYRIELLTFGDHIYTSGQIDVKKEIGECFDSVEIIPMNTIRRIKLNTKLSRIYNLMKPYQMTMGDGSFSDVMANEIQKKANSARYDIIYFSCLSSYMHHAGTECMIPSVVDVQDSPAVLMKSYYQMEKNIIKRFRALLNYLWARNYEKVHLSKIENMILVTENDAAAVRKRCPKSDIFVVSQGVDTDYYMTKNKKQVDGRLVFTGVMDYTPNHQAMIYFIKEVWPILRRQNPQVTLSVVGRNPSADLKALAAKADGIEITGYVEDVRPYVDEAVVYVCPLLSGAGIKNKILEAWAMSKPIVATSISCEGLDAKDGDNILVADNARMFAQKVTMILSDGNTRAKLVKRGRKHVEDSFSWRSKAKMIENIMCDIIRKKEKYSKYIN